AKLETVFWSNVDSVIAIPAGGKKRETNSGIMTSNLFEFTKQVLCVDISPLAAKAAGQRPWIHGYLHSATPAARECTSRLRATCSTTSKVSCAHMSQLNFSAR